MKSKKLMAIIIAVCMMLVMTGIQGVAKVDAASGTTLQVSNSQLMKGKDNSITVNLKDNDKTISGIQFFVKFDTDAFSVNDVVSKLSSDWELDWKVKNDSKYGKGVLCMIQDSTIKGITDAEKEILTIKLNDVKAKVGMEYEFNIDIIDVCDSNGNSIKSAVSGIDGTFTYLEEQQITISDDINIEGFQISQTSGGIRTVSSVEPKINGQEVVEFGNIYAVLKNDVTDKDMYIGSTNNFVASYKATEQGIIKKNFSDSETATNYVRTMNKNGTTSEAFTQSYMIRGYAKLADGSYVYSTACEYCIYDVAKTLYDDSLMPTYAGHEALYNDILKIVDKDYGIVDYDWKNTVAP